MIKPFLLFFFSITVKESSVALKTEPDETSADNMILILDSDDEEDSHEKSNASTNQKAVVADDFLLENDIVMESEDKTASMEQNQNNKHNVGTEVKKEISELKKEEMNSGDDIPLVLIQVETIA